VAEEFDASMTMLVRRRHPGGDCGLVLPAQLACDFCVRRWLCPCRPFPPLSAWHYHGLHHQCGDAACALSLVIGILVDDAIVEVENIERHLNMGKTPYQAAMEAADEIGLAVIATTFTLIAVFLPTAFMSGVPGEVLQAVRLDGSVRGVCLAGGGPGAHAR